MAHFAELDSNNIVKRVIVVSNKNTSDENGVENESIGISYLKGMFGDSTIWKQTSYNGNIRKYYAGKGMTYREDLDCFVPPQPYPSWTLNEIDVVWESPIPRPDLTDEQLNDGCAYYWDEEVYNENNSDGWILFEPPAEQSEEVI